MKYMIDFDRMLMMRFGYFDTEDDALAYIDEYFTEEEYRKWGWDSNYSAIKPLFKPIPIYPHGDERLDTHKYGRYSGGLR